jgi:cell division protein FtsN
MENHSSKNRNYLKILTINPVTNKLFTMKKILFVLLVIFAMIISCKTAKKAVPVQPAEKPPVEKVAEVNNKEKEVSVPENNVPIYMKTEEVSIAENEDQSKEGFAFYVIIGSFSKPENAGKFKIQLINKDFSPVLLNSESGYIRVAVDQTNSEAEARKVIREIRKNYPEHNDVWLLKNK